MCTRCYTRWLAHLIKGPRGGEVAVMFLAEKHAPDTGTVSTRRRPARPVSSGRGAREGLERADAGRGTPARSMHFCVAADTGDQTQCVSIRSR
jgi:hypothetical protein